MTIYTFICLLYHKYNIQIIDRKIFIIELWTLDFDYLKNVMRINSNYKQAWVNNLNFKINEWLQNIKISLLTTNSSKIIFSFKKTTYIKL